jgi:hypothetical protein
MNLTNPPKALIAMVAMIVIAVLMVADSIANEAGTGMLGTIVGYAVGNGVAAKSGKDVQPIIGKKAD